MPPGNECTIWPKVSIMKTAKQTTLNPELDNLNSYTKCHFKARADPGSEKR